MTTTAESEAKAPEQRRRRWLRASLIALAAVLVLALAALGGAGWYFSGEVIDVDHSESAYDITVQAVDDATVTLPRGKHTEKPGTWGLSWDGGQALIGGIVDEDEDTVTRTLDRVLYGDLAEGTAVRVDTYAYRDDPSALGLGYTTVDVPTDLGGMPAWHLPGDKATWVLTVHGRNASPAETLRGVEVYQRLGYPVLAVTYRNDEGAPEAPNGGKHSLGEHESDDVLAAVDYALANGAEDVILHGWSMGGAIVSTAARKIDDPAVIKGIVLDSPVMDWNSTLDMQAEDRNVVAPITWTAKRIVEWRADLDFDDLDQRNFTDEFDMPMLLFVDTADATVDHTATLDFAERLPADQATVVTTASGHTASWNEDPAAYTAALEAYLSEL